MHIFFFMTINSYLQIVSAALSSPLHLPLLFPFPQPQPPWWEPDSYTEWLLSGSNLIARETDSILRTPFLFTGAAQGGAGIHVYIKLHYHLLKSPGSPFSCSKWFLPTRQAQSQLPNATTGQARPSLVSSMNTVGLCRLRCMSPTPSTVSSGPKQVPHHKSLCPGDTLQRTWEKWHHFFLPLLLVIEHWDPSWSCLRETKTSKCHRNGGIGQQQQSPTLPNTAAHRLHSTCLSWLS